MLVTFDLVFWVFVCFGFCWMSTLGLALVHGLLLLLDWPLLDVLLIVFAVGLFFNWLIYFVLLVVGLIGALVCAYFRV